MTDLNIPTGDQIIGFLSGTDAIEKAHKESVRLLEQEKAKNLEILRQQYGNTANYRKYLMEYLEYIKPAKDCRGIRRELIIPEGFNGQIIHFDMTANSMHPQHDGSYFTYKFNDDLKEHSVADRSFLTIYNGTRWANGNNVKTQGVPPECCMLSGKYLIAAPAYVDTSIDNGFNVTRNDKHEMILSIYRLVPSPRIGSIYKGYCWVFPLDKADFDKFVAEKFEAFSVREKPAKPMGHSLL